MTASPDRPIKTVVVFCGSKFGNNPVYAQHARDLGALLGQNGYDLVYGGGTSGLMGLVSEAARDAGSKVTGIITEAFRIASWHNVQPGTEEIVFNELHQRKLHMLKKADAIVVLPGGIGTQDEQWEAVALLDMNIAGSVNDAPLKPVIVVNTIGFYDDTKNQMKKAISEGFIHPGREKLIRDVPTPADAIALLNQWNVLGLKYVRDIATPPLAKPPGPQ